MLGERKRRLEGPEEQIMSDLLELVKTCHPDIILLPNADTWVHLLVHKARRLGLNQTISRTGFFKRMASSKSHWSYGQVKHKEGALIPEGRILIDTAKSFTFSESGLKRVLLAIRPTNLSPNLTSRFTPGP
jgi:DNA polymerase I